MATSHAQPLLLLVFVSLFFLPTLAHDFLNCDILRTYDVKVSELRISPHPVKYNGTVQVTIIANTSRVISNETTVRFKSWSTASVTIYSTPHSLCKVTKCPVAAGSVVLTFSNQVPSDVFSGLAVSASISVTENNPKVKEVMCINFLIELDRT